MFISLTGKFIYLHVPKCGGTSVTRLLAQEASWQDHIVEGGGPDDTVTTGWSMRYGMFKHSIPSRIRTALGTETYRSYNKFMTVRDPIDRVKSTYNYFKANIERQASWFVETADYPLIDGMKSLESFIHGSYFKTALKVDAEEASDLQLCIKPQATYFDAEEASAGRLAVFPLDSLKRSTLPLVRGSFLREPRPFPHENSAERFDETLSERTLMSLHRAYEIDNHLFGLG